VLQTRYPMRRSHSKRTRRAEKKVVKLQSQHSRQARPKADNAVPSFKHSGAKLPHLTTAQAVASTHKHQRCCWQSQLHTQHERWQQAPHSLQDNSPQVPLKPRNVSQTDPVELKSLTAVCAQQLMFFWGLQPLMCTALCTPPLTRLPSATLDIQCTCAPSFAAAFSTGVHMHFATHYAAHPTTALHNNSQLVAALPDCFQAAVFEQRVPRLP
jgi:hypothetical protein